jgi:hypothetical protein
MGIRRFASTVVVGLCVLAGAVLLWGASAQALEVHRFVGSFGTEGSGSGQFKSPTGVAVNDTTHDVYVVDRDNGRVQELNSTGSTVLGEFNGSAAPTGAFSEPTQIAVDNSSNPLDPSKEDVYVVDHGHGVIDKFNASGTYEGQLTGVGTPGGAFEGGEVPSRVIEGVAVDPSGTVWVSTKNGPIYSFTDALANQYSSERSTAFGGAGEGLAVDSEDNLYLQIGGGVVAKINSSGATLDNPFGDDREAFSVAVDPSGDEVYLDNLESIDAFDLSGAPIESFGPGQLTVSTGITVDASNGMVYATDRTANRVVVFKEITVPSVGIVAVTEQQPRGLTVNGTVDPEGLPVSSCVFEYGTTSAYGHNAPCSPDPGSGSGSVPVSARLTGLTPGIVYHYRLVAENANGQNLTPDQEVFTGPRVSEAGVVNVASSSATLQVTIDPNGADTHYYFQYGPSAAYGSYAPVSPPGVDLGSGVGARSVSAHLQSLGASTAYHYRIVVVQGGEAVEGPDHVFTTQPASGSELTLPDGRAWELVSPPDKKAALIGPSSNYWLTQAADDGSGITYTTNEVLGEDTVGHLFSSQVLSTRKAGVWHTQYVAGYGGLPPEGESSKGLFEASEYWPVFSQDLSLGLLEPGSGPVAPQSAEMAAERTLYLRDSANGVFRPLESEAPKRPNSHRQPYYFASTPDLSHVVFGSPLALTPEAVEEECPGGPDNCYYQENENLYEWGEGRLQLVNILPDGTTKPFGTDGGASVGGAIMSTAKGEKIAQAISSDGRWIVWKYGGYQVGPSGQASLYVRDMVNKRTVKVGGPYARFETMSRDGSKVFFVETEGGEGGINGDLYVFDTTTDEQTDLTIDHGSAELSAGVQNAVLGASQDGSYVYFVATGVLASGAVSGADNLYLLHDGTGGWTTTLIATLSQEDKHTWGGDEYPGEKSHENPWEVSSEVSPNGRYVAFMSNSSLTGYDNVDAVSGQRDEEVFLYDAVSNRLVCVSCDPTGARPTGVFDGDEQSAVLVDRAGMWTNHWIAGSLVGWNNTLNRASYQPRYVMNNGRLFFNSPDALVPQDANGLEDVYEYEPGSVGSCASEGSGFSAVSGGCVNLISAGTSAAESAFMDASETGDDTFFVTSEKLTSEDYDNAYDMYDAHVCTSAVPCRAEPVSPPECTSGDSCKAAPSSQPAIFGATPSATFNGVGNVTASTTGPGVTPRSLTRAQKLARALRSCKKEKRKKRTVCERQARKRYGAKQARKATATKKGNG